MLLTITTTHQPATDLGYLLHKRPGKLQTFDLAFGRAHVFYPAAEEARCTAALLLDIDPLALVRGPGAMLSDYVNDRPYVSSSFLCVAISRVFGTALSGRCSAKPELAAAPILLEAHIAAVPLRGREQAGRAPVRAARLPGRVDGRDRCRRTLPQRHAAGNEATERASDARLRAAAGRRQPQALRNRRRRGRQAARQGQGLARPAPRARVHRPPVPRAPQGARRGRGRAPRPRRRRRRRADGRRGAEPGAEAAARPAARLGRRDAQGRRRRPGPTTTSRSRASSSTSTRTTPSRGPRT